MRIASLLPVILIAPTLLGAGPAADKAADGRFKETLRASFKEKGQAGLDRLDQDEVQALCSRRPADGPLKADVAKRLVAAQLATVAYPADGALMGDWKKGEAIAQSGVGKQFSDDPTKPSGGNCYACHQLSKAEVSFGTLGPSLYQYGKIRGQAEAMQRYTYGKIFNSQAFSACSMMPRFGLHGILTEEQIKDLVALLLDPASPVNQ